MNTSLMLIAIIMVKYCALAISLWFAHTTMVKYWEISQNVDIGYRIHDHSIFYYGGFLQL